MKYHLFFPSDAADGTARHGAGANERSPPFFVSNVARGTARVGGAGMNLGKKTPILPSAIL